MNRSQNAQVRVAVLGTEVGWDASLPVTFVNTAPSPRAGGKSPKLWHVTVSSTTGVRVRVQLSGFAS